MHLEQKVNGFYRAGIGLATFSISLALFFLVGFLLFKAQEYSLGVIGFIVGLSFLAIWFANLSYQLISANSQNKPYLLSPFSIACIFALLGVGTIAGSVYRFSTGDLEKGFFGLLVLCLLFPAGNYCWKFAKSQAAKQYGS